jgi:hypothetical protein
MMVPWSQPVKAWQPASESSAVPPASAMSISKTTRPTVAVSTRSVLQLGVNFMPGELGSKKAQNLPNQVLRSLKSRNLSIQSMEHNIESRI